MKDRRKPFTTTLPIQVMRELAEAAEQENSTRSAICEQALRFYFATEFAKFPRQRTLRRSVFGKEST